MKIRNATLKDIPALNELVNSAYRGESSRKGWTSEADLLDGIRTSETTLEEMIRRKNAVILVAEENEITGCVYLEQLDDALYLGMLTVKPDLQGKGLGAILMASAEDHAKSLGCKKIRMTVISRRNELIAYYTRKGFVDTNERAPFPSDPKFGVPKLPLEFMVMEKVVE
jgi:N-acetylglutamate synthase-like GNAT family acetyltransferase